METLEMARIVVKRKDSGAGIVAQCKLSRTEIEALDKAAFDDERTRSSLMKKIIAAWLRENGYLK